MSGCETEELAHGEAQFLYWQKMVSVCTVSRSAFQEGPVASKTAEMKIQANANVLIYNEKDGCGQSRMCMSADLEMISLQTSG